MKSIPSWLEADGVEEIIITDWNSSEPVQYNHEKVHIVRVKNVNYWSLTQAFNIAARFANGDIYAKLDADYRILNPSLFSDIGLEPGIFINGEDKLGPLNGFFYLYADDFWKVCGFDERMHGYGWDDTDLVKRLKRKGGLKLKSFDCEGNIEHIPHGDEVRGDIAMHTVNAKMAHENPWNASMPQIGVTNVVREWPNVTTCTIYPSIDFLYGV
jgi:glycosyltransferase involved in cell wall biosynthesis